MGGDPEGPGHTVALRWRGRSARAWVPRPLAERDLRTSERVVRLAEQAVAALAHASKERPPSWEPLARLLLRLEGIASSSIEGLRIPPEDVAAAEMADGDGDGGPDDAGWVADNLRVVTRAISEAGTGLRVARLHEWHAALMRHSRLPPAMIGAWRADPGWIGGTSPLDAAYVPPPPSHVAALMDDLVAYANGRPADAVTQAAIVHAQFETIHPYGDGNGRLGRVLIGWVLRRRGAVAGLPPPISVLIARDAGGYLSGLFQFREGSLDAWVGWFASIAQRAADATTAMVDLLEELVGDWNTRARVLRHDSAARALLPMLPGHPVLTAAHAARLTGVAERSARDALDSLVQLGILEPLRRQSRPGTRGRPPRYWIAPELLELTRRWSG